MQLRAAVELRGQGQQGPRWRLHAWHRRVPLVAHDLCQVANGTAPWIDRCLMPVTPSWYGTHMSFVLLIADLSDEELIARMVQRGALHPHVLGQLLRNRDEEETAFEIATLAGLT